MLEGRHALVTGGGTGIGLAMVGAFKGYRVKLALPACVSMERRQTLLAYGFVEGRYAAGNECITVVQMHSSGECVTASAAALSGLSSRS